MNSHTAHSFSLKRIIVMLLIVIPGMAYSQTEEDVVNFFERRERGCV